MFCKESHSSIAHLAPVAAKHPILVLSIICRDPATLMVMAKTHTMVIGTLQSKAADTMKMRTSQMNENARPVV